MGTEMLTQTCPPVPPCPAYTLARQSNFKLLHHSRVGLLLLLPCLIVLGLLGCAPSVHRQAANTLTPSPSATAHPMEPVTVVVAVEQEGTVAEHNVHLLVTVSVTNHTSRPINITVPGCNSPDPPVLIDVMDTAGKTVWQTHLWSGSCPLTDPRDALTLAPSAIQRWTIANDLSRGSVQYGNPPPGPLFLSVGTSYTVKAMLLQWHQGSVQDIGNPDVPQGIDVVGEISVVLR